MATSLSNQQHDFSEMDNAGVSKEHWKIMFISGMGFFTDAYDLFVIGVVMALLKPMWHVGKVEQSQARLGVLLRRKKKLQHGADSQGPGRFCVGRILRLKIGQAFPQLPSFADQPIAQHACIGHGAG